MSLLKKLAIASAFTALATSAYADTKLVVAASPVPHAEILEFVKPYLKEKGIDLEVKVFSDYILPNVVVTEGKADANFFQHQPYLDSYNKQHGTNIIGGFEVHIEPFGIYSNKYKDLKNVKDKALVAIPNDPSNEARALLLLQATGLIKLKDGVDLKATVRDIASNPHKLKFKEVEAATLPRVLKDVDFSLINANYALAANLNPVKDALAVENSGPYANFLAYLPQNANKPEIQALVEALNRPEVAKFIYDKYQGAVVPVFPAAKEVSAK